MNESDDIKKTITATDQAVQMLHMQAMLLTSLDLQAQIIAKLENRDVDEVSKAVNEKVSNLSKVLFKAI